MQNIDYQKERMERLMKILTTKSSEEELQKEKEEKQEKERKALERLEAKKVKEKARVSYERFMELENCVAENCVAQILILRDEIYVNTWNSYTREDYILKYHNVKYDEDTYIYGFSFDSRYRKFTQKEIKKILEENYDDYLDGHPFKDLT